MKKRNVFLKSLVAITLLSAMIVSAFLGTSNAEYLKTLKKKLDMEMTPDLDFAYRLYVNGASTTGVYKNTKNISQKFTKSSNDSDFLKIKVPVDEEGYYTISFNVDFWVEAEAGKSAVNSNGATDTNNKNYVRNLDTVVGCQMYSHKLRAGVAGAADVTNFFDSDAFVRVSSAGEDSKYSYFYGSKVPYSLVQLLETKRPSYDGYYQGIYRWQTLTPTRAEDVELSFYASGQDVKDGFMVWYWDLLGLKSGYNYELHLRDISIEKHDPREGLPYIEFGETKYVNNVKSVTTAGTTYPNRARGTYATTATFDKLVMQLNPLRDAAAANSASTPMSFSVPIKNVKANTSYKVYFDFSIALQEGNAPYNYSSNYGSFFKTTNTATVNNGNNFYFKSYLHNGPVSVDTVAGHEAEIKTVTNANKVQEKKEMTDYSDLLDTPAGAIFDVNHSAPSLGYTSVAVGDNLYLEVTTDPVRDAITIDSMTHAQALNYANTSVGCDIHTQTLGTAHKYGVNWLNAIRHSEVNSETKIHWLTFYNTNFTFNVSNVTDLNWVWAIDGLVPTNWYRIKIDNVRIEEVVPYGSFQMKGMLNIEGVDCDDFGTAVYDTDTRGNFVRSTFRYSNGTGQNYRPRGYVDTAVNDNNVLSANNIFGAIYDAGDIYISNEKSIYDENEPLGDYTIGLRGYTAVKGGVNKYVWSVDGGKTWHDMAYEETLSNHTIGDEGEKVYGESLRAPWLSTVSEPSMITQYCESFVDQGFIGLKDYSGKIKRGDKLAGQTQGDLTYVKDTIEVRGDKNHEYSVDQKDSTGDFVDFLYGVDDINSLYIYMQADLSEYKDHFNLDVVFAAVPNGNPDARCEILRIINYNPMPNYRTVTNDIESDITIMASSTSPASNLSAYCRANRTDLGHENKIGFPIMSGVILDDNYGYSNSDGYSQLADSFYNYEDVRCLFYDFPIMKTLKVRGYAIIEGGAEGYCWSVDFGRTWTDCAVTASKTGTDSTDSQRKYWYDGVNKKTENDTIVDFGDKTYFSATGQGLTADLSSYIGQTVDVIFAAKSKLGGPPCPVARIDNVSVWGTGEKGEGMGPFYSFTGEFFYEDENNDLQQFSQVYSAKYSSVTTTPWGASQNNTDQWDIIFPDSVRPNVTYYGASHSIYEPYNVNPIQTRKFYADEITVRNGARFQISGFMMCHGGVAKYKLSLDGGETFVDLQCVGGDDPDNNSLKRDFLYSRMVDATFDADDVENSTYSEGYGGWLLEFYLPAQTPGARRELLVVAEGTNGYDYPVLRLTLRIAGDTPALVYYQQGGTIIRDNWPDAHKNDPSNVIKKGYNAYLEKAPDDTQAYIESERTHLNDISAGDVYTASPNNRYRLTVPVEEVGWHSLRFYLSVVDGVSHPEKDKTDYGGSRYTGNITISSYLLHDSGETYYNDMNKQITESNKQDFANRIDKDGSLTFTNPYFQLAGYSSGAYHLYINVTEEDVGRGYVVWDFDITEFSRATGGYEFRLIVDYKWFGLKADEGWVSQ